MHKALSIFIVINMLQGCGDQLVKQIEVVSPPNSDNLYLIADSALNGLADAKDIDKFKKAYVKFDKYMQQTNQHTDNETIKKRVDLTNKYVNTAKIIIEKEFNAIQSIADMNNILSTHSSREFQFKEIEDFIQLSVKLHTARINKELTKHSDALIELIRLANDFESIKSIKLNIDVFKNNLNLLGINRPELLKMHVDAYTQKVKAIILADMNHAKNADELKNIEDQYLKLNANYSDIIQYIKAQAANRVSLLSVEDYILVFGDSMSDTHVRHSKDKVGNQHISWTSVAFGYYAGRYSDGPIWVDYLMMDSKYSHYTWLNEAEGGAVLASKPATTRENKLGEEVLRGAFNGIEEQVKSALQVMQNKPSNKSIAIIWFEADGYGRASNRINFLNGVDLLVKADIKNILLIHKDNAGVTDVRNKIKALIAGADQRYQDLTFIYLNTDEASVSRFVIDNKIHLSLPKSFMMNASCLGHMTPHTYMQDAAVIQSFRPLTFKSHLPLPSQADYTKYKIAVPDVESSNLNWLSAHEHFDTNLDYIDLDKYNDTFKKKYAKDCYEFGRFDLWHPTTTFSRLVIAPFIKDKLDLVK